MLVFHTIVAILLVIVVLMQSAKGEGLAGAFGGGGGALTGAVFGGRGAASFLSKATTVLAIVFMINCGILAYMSSHRTGSASTTSSAVTTEAQKEMERQAQQQQMIPPEGGEQMPGVEGEAGQLPAGDQPQAQPETQPEGGGQ